MLTLTLNLQAIHDYNAEDDRMLPLRAGDIVRVLGEYDGWLYAINADGYEGYVPPTYLATPEVSPDSDTAERRFFDAGATEGNDGNVGWDGEAQWLEGLQESFNPTGGRPRSNKRASGLRGPAIRGSVEEKAEMEEEEGTKEAETESNGVRQTPTL